MLPDTQEQNDRILIEINVGKGKPYYSQRVNQIRPLITCNDTSMVAFLSYSGIALPTDPKYPDIVDSLTNFMLTDLRVDAQYQKLFPVQYNAYIAADKDPNKSTPPNEIHPVLSYGANLWLGKQPGEVTKFRWDMSFQEVLFEFLKGHAVVQSGVFNGLHHVVCPVGFITNQKNIHDVKQVTDIDMSLVGQIIIDDPYGNFHQLYQNHDGQGVLMTPDEYRSMFNYPGNDLKWTHYIV